MKKLFILSGLTLALASCGNGADEAKSEETHEAHEESGEYHHEHVLDINLTVDNEADPNVISVELLNDGEAYEADRVRFEVQAPEEEDTVWLNAEHQGEGVYTAEAAEVEAGEHTIVAHINGPEELHEHTEEVFEIK